MTATLAFSQFTGPFIMDSDDIIVGLRDGENAQFYASGGGGSVTWQQVTTDQVLEVNNGYIAAGGGVVDLTLPSTFVVGDVIRVTNLSGSFRILIPASRTVNFGNVVASTSIASANVGDSVELVGVSDNNIYQIISSMGNLTII